MLDESLMKIFRGKRPRD